MCTLLRSSKLNRTVIIQNAHKVAPTIRAGPVPFKLKKHNNYWTSYWSENKSNYGTGICQGQNSANIRWNPSKLNCNCILISYTYKPKYEVNPWHPSKFIGGSDTQGQHLINTRLIYHHHSSNGGGIKTTFTKIRLY